MDISSLPSHIKMMIINNSEENIRNCAMRVVPDEQTKSLSFMDRFSASDTTQDDLLSMQDIILLEKREIL